MSIHRSKLAVPLFVANLFVANAIPGAHALSLQEAAQMAVNSNPELQSAQLEREARVHEVRFAEAGYYPEVDAVTGIGRERTRDDNNDTEVLTRREAALTAEQMLFDGFGTRSEVERQKARQRSAAETAELTAEDVALDAVKAYLSVLREHELYLLAQDTKENHQSIYDQMQLREQSGVGSQADLDQITGRLALASTNVLTTQSNLVDASTSFHAVVGVYPDVGNMQYPQLTLALPKTLDDALARAQANNPAIKSALADIDAGKAQYEASKSPFYPRISLEARQGFDDNIGGVEGDESDSLIALRMRYNLYRGGADSARKRQTAVLMNEAMEIRNDKQRKVMQALRFSWNAVEAVEQQIPYLEMHVKAAGSTKEAYGQQFNIGRRTLLDLLNTENEEVDAKRSLIKGHSDQAISRLQLLNAMGELRTALALKTQSPAMDASAETASTQ